MSSADITREDVHDIVVGYAGDPEGLEDYVRVTLLDQYPDLAAARLRRGGQSYSALDYLLGDLVTYGQDE